MNFKTQLILAALFLAAGCPEAPLDTTDTKDTIPADVDGDSDTDADADADSDADADTDTATHTGG